MTFDSAAGQSRSVLEHFVETLQSDADAFYPARPSSLGSIQDLPDREPGANLAAPYEVPTGAAAVVLDCGISRREGYTHVLWLSMSAESIVGSHHFSRLAEVIGSLESVSGYEWEGLDRLHVRAAGVDWDDLLAEARDAVSRLIA